MNQIKIIFTRGIIASGKSTWANQFVKEHQDYKRVCRDDLRHMLFSYTFNNENEKLVTQLERDIIEDILQAGYNLIIDKQNLNDYTVNDDKKFINDWFEKQHENNIVATFEIKDFPITLEEAIERDKKRDFVIGEKIIRNTWKKYEHVLMNMLKESKNVNEIEYDCNLPDAVCFDLDGTLALNNGHRNAYDYSKIIEDTPNKIVIEQTFYHKSKGRTIIIVSGRDSCEVVSIKWLKKYNIPFDFIFMRKTGDKRKDSIVKEEIYNNNIKNKFNVLAVYDDRPQVIKKWRELGLFVFDCGKGIEF